MKRTLGANGVRSLSWALVGLAIGTVVAPPLGAQQNAGQLREPVYRVTRAKNETPQPGARHALDPALDLARVGLDRMRNDIRDYECVLVKRERIKGELNEQQFIYTKVRNRQQQGDRQLAPFSVYMNFLKPDEMKGREVIYVEGQNNGKLCAHEGGRRGAFLPTVWLAPDSTLAMMGQLYPITDVGIENLVSKLIERGEREKKFPDVQVEFKKNAKVNGRVCTVLEIMHPTNRPEYEFQRAHVFIDDELNVPIRYAAYGWPTKDEKAPVLEEYTYTRLKVNIGLTDADFDPDNEQYNF